MPIIKRINYDYRKRNTCKVNADVRIKVVYEVIEPLTWGWPRHAPFCEAMLIQIAGDTDANSDEEQYYSKPLNGSSPFKPVIGSFQTKHEAPTRQIKQGIPLPYLRMKRKKVAAYTQ